MPRTLSLQVRHDILGAARALALGDGIDRCTLDEIARRAGVARTTVYRHFGSLDRLLLEVVNGLVLEAPSVDTGSLRGDLMAIQANYSRAARQPTARRLFTWMLTRSIDDPVFAADFRRVRIQPGGPTTVALQRAIARGELAAETDLDLAMHLIQGPFVSKIIIDNQELNEGELATLIDQIVRALGAVEVVSAS